MIRGAGAGGAAVRLGAIALAIATMATVLVLASRWLATRAAGPGFPPPGEIGEFGDPIAAEAGVFRTNPAEAAVPETGERRDEAHRRTYAMYRTLRAYPGAPPRIPHGLATTEYQDASCQTCHERGGYVARFTSYAPVTPHPEYRRGCLQCHAPDDGLVGIGLPDGRPGSVCRQCHIPDRPTPSFVASTFQPAAWPAIGRSELPGAPPPIPHDLHMRSNCATCHVGAAAVEEIRTTHPERANCRQCHMLAASDADAFSRPLERGAAP